MCMQRAPRLFTVVVGGAAVVYVVCGWGWVNLGGVVRLAAEQLHPPRFWSGYELGSQTYHLSSTSVPNLSSNFSGESS